MAKVGWAALCTAGVLACTSQASATVMEAHWDGIFESFLDVRGLISAPGTFFPQPPCCFPPVGPRPVLFSVWTYYDTGLGTITGGPTFSVLDWTAADAGASPFLGALIFLEGNNGASITFSIEGSSSFSTVRSDSGQAAVSQDIVGSWGHLDLRLRSNSPVSIDQSDPLSAFSFPWTQGFAFPGTQFSEPLSQSLAIRPVSAAPDFNAVPHFTGTVLTSIPEPGVWALLVIGFFSLGSALRLGKSRSRSRSGVTALASPRATVTVH